MYNVVKSIFRLLNRNMEMLSMSRQVLKEYIDTLVKKDNRIDAILIADVKGNILVRSEIEGYGGAIEIETISAALTRIIEAVTNLRNLKEDLRVGDTKNVTYIFQKGVFLFYFIESREFADGVIVIGFAANGEESIMAEMMYHARRELKKIVDLSKEAFG